MRIDQIDRKIVTTVFLSIKFRVSDYEHDVHHCVRYEHR